ncbi:MAG: rhodanese-like domain-containing protein [Desulfovibrio sp.]|uniref:rhodanese-like domain-containing protein n=1 Tax=Desulfovibrio sp. TaxID=885 RepID=UPI00135DCBAC|nr:rhodanese-like domain-containing protein [Desulfovibrio sp.]MTJ93785.1 rhodanese-like domain-containing protein [Desulfovibrio sp.]
MNTYNHSLKYTATAILLVCFFAFQALPAGAQMPEAGRVDASVGKSLIDDFGKHLLVIDVRTPEEFGQGHIPEAVNIPIEELAQRSAEIPPNVPTLLVCRTGRRAEAAYLTLQKSGQQHAQLWYLAATPVYEKNGTFTFK